MVATTKTILAKKEATYLTDPVPTVTANAVVTRQFSAVPLEVDQLERNLDVPFRGRLQTAPTAKRGTRSFELELAGSGTAGTAAPWMEFLEACGMAAPVITASTDAKQKFCAAGVDCSSLAFCDWHENQQRKLLGSRGTYGFNFTAGAYPFLTLNYTGLIPVAGPVATVTPGAPDFTRWKTPVEVNDENTDVLLGGFAVVMKSLTGEAGVDVKLRNLVGARYIQVGNHVITGRLQVEAPTLASKNYFTNLDVGDHLPLSVTHGLGGGKIVGLDTSYLQITSIALTEEDEKLMLDIGYGMNVVAGQDDLLLTAK